MEETRNFTEHDAWKAAMVKEQVAFQRRAGFSLFASCMIFAVALAVPVAIISKELLFPAVMLFQGVVIGGGGWWVISRGSS